jgi:hypothetical protein
MEQFATPKDWLASAIYARSLASQLSDTDAKRVLEEVADDCELMPQRVGMDAVLRRLSSRN